MIVMARRSSPFLNDWMGVGTSNRQPESHSFTNQVTMHTKVLIVDDDHETADLIRMLLEPDSFEVLMTTSGQEGATIIRDVSPDVMIIDLMMPDMDGLKVCKEVRKFSTIPILVLSSIGKPGIAEQALDEGADDYLVKPMNKKVLIACLNKLTRRARAEQEASKRNGGQKLHKISL